jgi:hypothetical protein
VNSTAKKSSMDGNNSSSVMAALRPEKADFTVSLPAQAQGTLRGIDIKALPLEENQSVINCTIFIWSDRQILAFQIHARSQLSAHSHHGQVDRGQCTLIDAVECGLAVPPTLLIVSEDASHCACVEGRSIVVRCTQLRRRQQIACLEDSAETATITAMAFVQADVQDLVVALNNGVVYVSYLRTLVSSLLLL